MGISAKDVKALRDRTNAPMMECKGALEEANGDVEAAIKILRERGIAKAAKRADRDTGEGVIRVQAADGMRGVTAVKLACETDFSARSEDFQALADHALKAAMSLAGGEVTVEKVLAASVDGKTVQEHLDEVANKIRENMKLSEVVHFDGLAASYLHHDGSKAAVIEFEGPEAATDELSAFGRSLCMHIVATNPPPVALTESDIPQELLEQEKEIFVKQAIDSGKPKEIAEKMVGGRMKKFVQERALLEQEYARGENDEKVKEVVAATAKQLGSDLAIKRFARLSFGD